MIWGTGEKTNCVHHDDTVTEMTSQPANPEPQLVIEKRPPPQLQ